DSVGDRPALCVPVTTIEPSSVTFLSFFSVEPWSSACADNTTSKAVASAVRVRCVRMTVARGCFNTLMEPSLWVCEPCGHMANIDRGPPRESATLPLFYQCDRACCSTRATAAHGICQSSGACGGGTATSGYNTAVLPVARKIAPCPRRQSINVSF